MSKGEGNENEKAFQHTEMFFFTICLQIFYRFEFDGGGVIYSLGCGKQENHNKINFKRGEANTN